MKKILLLSVLSLSLLATTSINSSNASEATSGGGPIDVNTNARISGPAGGTDNVGGGTWTRWAKIKRNGKDVTVSEYSHRSKKHSATVMTGQIYTQDIRNAGTTAKASRAYVQGKNSVYWNNAATGKVGVSTGGSW